jgi:3',5'-cyclic AMP phosphodiesterase CpdA
MRIGIFSDPHYSSQEITCGKRYNSCSLAKIRAAYEDFKREHCDLIVCLGDLTDKEETIEKELQNLREISDVMHDCRVPTVCLMGNHDAFTLTPEQFYGTLGIDPPADRCIDGKTLIFLDACYFRSGVRYAPGDSDWRDAFLPNESVLKEKLDRAEHDVYIFIHQNIDPSVRADHRISNAESVFEIIGQSGAVKAVFQGHYHPGKHSKHDGVEYVTLPAMCENEAAYFIYEI